MQPRSRVLFGQSGIRWYPKEPAAESSSASWTSYAAPADDLVYCEGHRPNSMARLFVSKHLRDIAIDGAHIEGCRLPVERHGCILVVGVPHLQAVGWDEVHSVQILHCLQTRTFACLQWCQIAMACQKCNSKCSVAC